MLPHIWKHTVVALAGQESPHTFGNLMEMYHFKQSFSSELCQENHSLMECNKGIFTKIAASQTVYSTRVKHMRMTQGYLYVLVVFTV